MSELLQDKEWLVSQYIDKYKSGLEIANKLKVTKYAVYRALEKHDIKRRKRTNKYPLLNDKEWIKHIYLVEKMSLVDIAKETGSTPGNVRSVLVSFGVEIRNEKEALKVKYPNGRYGELASNWQGGKRKATTPNPQYKKRLGELAANWKGGKVATSGYIYIYNPDHPNATKAGYVMEHRLVMEKELGRYLERSEIVHHINGDRQDNRVENLQVVSRSKHVSDHFANGYELNYWKEKVKQLEEESKWLKAEIERLENR